MSWFRVRYRVRAAAHEIEAIAAAIALEQSVEVPRAAVRDAFIAEQIVGRVDAIRAVDESHFDIDILLATETTAGDPAQTLNMLFGNTSMHEHVQLIDAELPDELLARCGGPRFGIEGLRELAGAKDRALSCAALKPQGLSNTALADLCYRFAIGGVDFIKDDHGLANQNYSPFAERVHLCQQAISLAAQHEGVRPCYVPNLIGTPATLIEQAHIAREEGVRAVMLAPSLIGLPTFNEMVAQHLRGMAVLAHPSFSGMRMAPALLLGKLFRIYGADAVIYPHYMGRFAYSQAQCAHIADECRRPQPGLRAAMPVPAGGMVVERVGELLQFYGTDVMLLIGGSLLLAGEGEALTERTRAFVKNVHGGGEL